MDALRSFVSSNRFTRQPPFDGYVDVEEINGDEYQDDYDYDDDEDDDGKSELACPFCYEDFDVVGFCCHIDERHIMDTKSGVCPICADTVGINIVAHLIAEHESLLRSLSKKRQHNGVFRPAPSFFRKDLLDRHCKSLHKETSSAVSSLNIAPDSLMLSFINSSLPADRPETMLCSPAVDANSSKIKPDGHSLERFRSSQPSPPDKNQEKKALKCEFVQGLILSVMLDDL